MRALWAIAAVLWLSCSAGSAYPPRVVAMAPTEGADDVDVPVEITGENFEPKVFTDFGRPSQSQSDQGFAATLVPIDEALPRRPLLDVRLARDGVLVGTVPRGTTRGFYGLEVADAAGRTGFVSEVYRVVGSPAKVARFSIESIGPQRPGVPFSVRLAAVDADGKVVDGFTGGVDVSDALGMVSPARLEPFVLGRLRGQLTVNGLSSSETVTVVDAQGRRGTSNPFAVLPGVVVELAFVSAAQTLTAGSCSKPVELEVRDGFGFASTLEAPMHAELSAPGPVAVQFFSDAACATAVSSVEVPAKQGRLTFFFRAQAAGAVTLRVVPSLLPSASQVQTVTQ